MVVWLETPRVLWLGGRNHFSQSLYVKGVSDIRQTEIQKAELLVPEKSAFEFVMAIGKLNRHISPDVDQILAEIGEWTRSKF